MSIELLSNENDSFEKKNAEIESKQTGVSSASRIHNFKLQVACSSRNRLVGESATDYRRATTTSVHQLHRQASAKRGNHPLLPAATTSIFAKSNMFNNNSDKMIIDKTSLYLSLKSQSPFVEVDLNQQHGDRTPVNEIENGHGNR